MYVYNDSFFHTVALNYQYPGLAMDLNRGRFLKNGGCGYVLKPAVMREGETVFIVHIYSNNNLCRTLNRNDDPPSLLFLLLFKGVVWSKISRGYVKVDSFAFYFFPI